MMLRFHPALLLILGLPTASAQTFYKTYGTTTDDEVGNAVVATTDGNMLVGGSRNDSALVIKVDPGGEVLWSRTFKPLTGSVNSVTHLAIGANGEIAGCGNSFSGPYPQSGFYFKLDPNGTLQWSYIANEPVITYTARIVPMTGGEFLLFSDMYQTGGGTWGDPVRERIASTTGAVTWSSPRLNYISSNPYIDDVQDAVAMNGSYYATGRIYVDGANNDGMRPYLSRFDSAGVHQGSSYLLFPFSASAQTYGGAIAAHQDSLTIAWMGDPNSAGTNYELGAIRCDTLGNVSWSKNYDIVGSSAELVFSLARIPGGYVMAGYHGSITGTDLFMLAFDDDGDLLWTRSFGSSTMVESHGYVRNSPMTVAANSIWLTGFQQTSPTDRDLVLIRTDLNGDVDCIVPQPFTVTTLSIPPSSTPCIVNEVTDPIDYPAGTSAYDTVDVDDVCALSLDLGPDTTVCDPYIIDASGTGATSYLWQDGTTLPTMPVQGPGIFWLTIGSGCCTATDTIVVAFEAPPNPLFAAAQLPGEPLIWQFTHGVVGEGCNDSLYWDFGDGTTGGGPSVVHTFPGPGTYSVCLTVLCACDSSTHCQDITILPTGSASLTADDEPVILPNPASDRILVVVPQGHVAARSSIIDMTGRTVRYNVSPERAHHFEVSDLAPGRYVVVIESTDTYQWRVPVMVVPQRR